MNTMTNKANKIPPWTIALYLANKSFSASTDS